MSSIAWMACSSESISQVIFTEVAEESGISFQHLPSPDGYPDLEEWTVAGLAIGDFDRNGWPDIFVCSGGLSPDALFMANGDGTFTDMAGQWGLTDIHCGSGAAAADIDGDGWTDLLVTSFGSSTDNAGEIGKNKLYLNQSGTGFIDVALQSGIAFNSYDIATANGACFGDYDLDGDLDVHIAAWEDDTDGNRLFRNNGDGTFTDVTVEAGVHVDVLFGFQGAFVDMDGDGWPELLLAADFETSRYFRNNRDGTFTDVTIESGTGLDDNGMGHCIGDFNNDGLLDWFVTSIHMEVPPPWMLVGNKLYLNQSGHVYQEAAEPMGVLDGGWGWGTIAIDVDHDRLLDIVMVNGRPAGEWLNEVPKLYYNLGNEFIEVGQFVGLVTPAEGRSISSLDFDLDGDMDFVIANNGDRLELYRNDSKDLGSWLTISLDTSKNPQIAPNGFGARIELAEGENTQVRFFDGGPNYLGTNQLIQHFGLADASVIDQIVVHWPRGYTTVLADVPVDQHIVIEAPSIGDLDGNGVIDGGDLGRLLARWGAVQEDLGRMLADLDGDGWVDGVDLGMLLARWLRR